MAVCKPGREPSLEPDYASILILAFQPLDGEKINFWCLSHSVYILLWQPMLIQMDYFLKSLPNKTLNGACVHVLGKVGLVWRKQGRGSSCSSVAEGLVYGPRVQGLGPLACPHLLPVQLRLLMVFAKAEQRS